MTVLSPLHSLNEAVDILKEVNFFSTGPYYCTSTSDCEMSEKNVCVRLTLEVTFLSYQCARSLESVTMEVQYPG